MIETAHESWRLALAEEWNAPYFTEIMTFLDNEEAQGRVFYPPRPLVFNALRLTPLDNVKVVILGQDPYHGEGQAHGLAFSVPDGVRPPPSLKNMFKELARDCGAEAPTSGCLQRWADQGVLLLNTTLTVSAGKAASHAGIGWKRFTDRVIALASEQPRATAFLLWGAHAQSKRPLIDATRHLVLETAHPSPLSARRGFFGCGHFGQANAFLNANGRTPIRW